MTVARLENDRVVPAQTGIAFADVSERSPAAGHVVALCCFLAADDIPRRLLLNGVAELPEELAEALQDPVTLIEAAAIIESYGLMRVDGDAFSIHRRVQASVRDAFGEEDRRFWAASASRIVLFAFPRQPEDSRQWTWTARLVPHAMAAIEHLEALDLEPVLQARLLDSAARYLVPQGQLAVASELLERALAGLEAAQPEGMLYPSVLNHFATAERERGHFNAALRDARRALKMHRASLSMPAPGYHSPKTSAQTEPVDDILEGVQPGEDALEGVEEEVPTDPEIADDLRNLGVIAQQRGEFRLAHGHLKQALEMRVLLDGEEAPAVAAALIDLFNLYLEAGHHAESIDMLRRAIEIEEAAYGATDEVVIVNKRVLSILTAPEDLDRKARDVLARIEAYYGPRHPQTADASRLLAVMLRHLGEYDEARRMELQALEIDRDNYGAMHFRAGTGLADLMAIEARVGDVAAAEEYLRQVAKVVLAAPSAERATTLRLSGLNLRLAEAASLDQARGLVVSAESILDEAFTDDESLRNPTLEMLAGALLAGGDALLHLDRRDEAREKYGEGLRFAQLTTENPLDDADFHIRLGLLAASGDDEARAAEHLDKAMQSLVAGGVGSAIWPLLILASSLYQVLGRPLRVVEALDTLLDQTMQRGMVHLFRSEIAVPVPEDWFTKQSTTLLAPDGQANIIASSEPLDPTITVEKYAEVQGELLEREFPDYVLKSFEQTTVFGEREGYIRHFQWTPPDGVTVTQLQVYYAENGRGYTATATTPAETFPDRELVLREVLRGLRLQN